MKVEIQADATLIVMPENELEKYALEKWYKDFNREDIKNRESILFINFTKDLNNEK